MLDFQRMDVYVVTRQLNRTLSPMLKKLRGRRDWVDQARRAGASVALNIAEGSGQYTPGEKIRYYRIAKGSASECLAVLDLLVDDELLTEPQVSAAGELCERITAMLIRLIQKIETRPIEQSATTAYSRARRSRRV